LRNNIYKSLLEVIFRNRGLRTESSNKKGRAISDPASDSSDSPPVDYSEYLLMKDQFQPAGFNPSKYDFGDQFLFSNSGFLVQGGK
jgi:hypothetical protein